MAPNARIAGDTLVERALKNHGTVLIPAFSIGRTQELLYELEEIIHRQKLAAAKKSGAVASGQVTAGKAVTAGAMTNNEHDQLNQREATGKAMTAAAGLAWDAIRPTPIKKTC